MAASSLLTGLVDISIYVPRYLARQPGHGLELLLVASRKRSGDPKCWTMACLRLSPTPGELVEQRQRGPRVPAAPVKAKGEPMRLVPHSLQE